MYVWMRIVESCLGCNLLNQFEAWLIALVVSEIAAVESPANKGTTVVTPNSRLSDSRNQSLSTRDSRRVTLQRQGQEYNLK